MTDPVAVVIDVLARALPGVDVRGELPPEGTAESPSATAVTVSRSGGPDTPYLMRPEMELLCWAPTDAQARALAYDCLHALQGAAEDHPSLSSAAAVTDGADPWSAGAARYRLLVDLTINV